MKHWFVDWLEEYAEKRKTLVEKYYTATEYNSFESNNIIAAFENDSNEIKKWADRADEDAKHLIKWAQLMEDMINCGLEELAFCYYDVKQSINPGKLPPRPKKAIVWSLNGVIEQLEQKMEESIAPEQLEILDAVYKTIVELDATEMSESAVVYYLRAKSKYPELKLPELEQVE